jgi:hypothetical protein
MRGTIFSLPSTPSWRGAQLKKRQGQPYLTLPYLTLPYLTLPYLTLQDIMFYLPELGVTFYTRCILAIPP